MAKELTLDEALKFSLKFAEKKGATEFEAYAVSSREISIGLEKSIPQTTTGISEGLSIRVVANKNIGFAFTKTLTKDRLESTIKAALQNARSKGPDPDYHSLPQPASPPPVKFTFDEELLTVTADSLADGLEHVIKKINAVKSLKFLQGQLSLTVIKDHLINSNGVDISSQGGGIGGFTAAITTKGLIPNYSFGIHGSPTLKGFNYDILAQETIKQTLRAAGPKTMNFNKEVPIILEPEASFGLLGGLFSLLFTQLQGNNVDRGATPYSDQVGNQIAVENFTLIDNGLNTEKINRSLFDAEGTPQQKTVLIEKGVLQTYLLDSYYGHKLGLESNGKSTRMGIFGFGGDPVKTYPSISQTIPEVAPGDSSKEEMFAETKEGFLLRSLMGMHMSDSSSGRFSVTGFGWYIKNGEIQYPVQGINISGFLPELLKNIDLISKEREALLLADSPYIRFASVPVTAKKFDFKTRFGLTLLKIISVLTGKHPMT